MTAAALNWLNPFRRQQPNVERKIVLGTSEALGSFLIFGTDTGVTASSAINLYNQSTAASVPINMVVDAFKVMDPILMVGDTAIRDHDVIKFLRNPSPYYTQEQLFEVLGKDFLITNEAPFVLIGQPNRPPLEIQPISPTKVSVNMGQGGLVNNYHVSGNTLSGSYRPKLGKNNSVKYLVAKGPNLREFVFIRGYSTRDNSLLRGQSLLRSAAKEVRQHILGSEHNVSLLEKGGRVSLVFHFDADLSPDEFEQTKARVLEQYGGVNKAGQIGITTGGKMDIKQMGTTNIDMDFGNLQEIASRRVGMQYHIPLPLLSDSAATFDNFKQAKLALYDDAVIPLSSSILNGLGDALLPRYGLDPATARLVFDPDRVTALVSRRNEEMLKKKQIGIETTNELRALISREDIGDEGDTILVPATMIPLGEDRFTLDNERDFIEPVAVE